MAELKIPQVILRERRAKNLTQEELAEVLDALGNAIIHNMAIPEKTPMDVGCPDVFGGAKVTKYDSEDYSVDIVFPDGKQVWAPYLWLFWQLRGDIAGAMMKWTWFDGVKDDPRYTALLEKAKVLAGI